VPSDDKLYVGRAPVRPYGAVCKDVSAGSPALALL
jgi:hypothetical protein